jgi:hypothetical protein
LLVFAGLSPSTVLDSNGSDDNQDDRANDDSGDAGQTSNTRILTAGADQLFLRDSTPTTINALAGDDTITTIGNQDLKALLGPAMTRSASAQARPGFSAATATIPSG